MKALFFRQHGRIENLEYGDLPEPAVGINDVLVEVKACALNHLDLWVLRGWPGLKLALPHIGGSDIAGVVSRTGAAVKNWEAGQQVVVCPGYAEGTDQWISKGEDSVSPNYKIFGEHKHGGLAQYVSVPANCLYPKPENLDFTNASAPLLSGLTAWRMLKHRANLQKGETVLIVGAGGGLNSLTIQVAKHLGAKVISLTSSEEKMQKAKKLGSDVVINYRETPQWSKEVKSLTLGLGVDVVVDNVGQATMPESLKAASRGGRIVTVGNTSGPQLEIDNRFIFGKQLSIIGSTMGSQKDFEAFYELLSSGIIKPVVDSTFRLAEGAGAYGVLEKGTQFGKVVITF